MPATQLAKPLSDVPANPVTAAPTETQVSSAQTLLNRLGYGPLAVNGKLDAATQTALTAFLKTQGLDWNVNVPVDFATLVQGLQTYADSLQPKSSTAPAPSVTNKLKSVPKWVWFAGGALAVAWYVNERMGEKSEAAPSSPPASPGHIEGARLVKPAKPKRKKGDRVPDISVQELTAAGEVLDAV